MYPDYVEHDSAYEFLAEAYLAKGDKATPRAATGAVLPPSAAAIPKRSRSSRNCRTKPESKTEAAADTRASKLYLSAWMRRCTAAR